MRRYGTNLKWYHQRWNETETNDNFFHVRFSSQHSQFLTLSD